MSEGRIDGRAADELIVRMAAGDMAALEALYNAMYGEIFAYLRSMLGGDVQSAEDLAQDTFIRAYRYAPKFAAMGQGRAWVYRIAGRLAFTHLRKLPPVVGEPEPAIPSGADVEESALASRASAPSNGGTPRPSESCGGCWTIIKEGRRRINDATQ